MPKDVVKAPPKTKCIHTPACRGFLTRGEEQRDSLAEVGRAYQYRPALSRLPPLYQMASRSIPVDSS
jgi:hypothetical protein